MSCARGAIGKYDKRVLRLIKSGVIVLNKKSGKVYSGKSGDEIGAVKHGKKGTTDYRKVSLPIGKRKESGARSYEWFPIHRAMALSCFGLPPEGKDRVNHIDGNGLNNRIKNLEWCSAKENTHHAIALGTMAQNGEDNRQAILTETDVRAILLSTKSDHELSAIYGVGYKTIQTIRYGERWRHIFDEVSKTEEFREARRAFARRSQLRKVNISKSQLKSVLQTSMSAPKTAELLGVTKSIVRTIRSSKLWEWARKKYGVLDTYSKVKPTIAKRIFTARGSHERIADKFCVSIQAVSNIKSEKTFSSVTKGLKRG